MSRLDRHLSLASTASPLISDIGYRIFDGIYKTSMIFTFLEYSVFRSRRRKVRPKIWSSPLTTCFVNPFRIAPAVWVGTKLLGIGAGCLLESSYAVVVAGTYECQHRYWCCWCSCVLVQVADFVVDFLCQDPHRRQRPRFGTATSTEGAF